MTIYEQNIIKERFDNNIAMLDEFGSDIIKVDFITIDDFNEDNQYFGKLYYDSVNYQYRILEEVNFNNIKLK